jgi:uncharacterized membrane protein YhaH (DUF805 family)
MGGNIDLRVLFLSADGRLSRAAFWVAAVALLAVGVAYEAIAGVTVHWITGWVVYPVLIYCGVCVLSKRLHDRGRSGWFAAPVMLAIIGVWPDPFGFFDLFWWTVLIWAIVELALLHGELGPNRYGANPLRPAVAL